MDAASLDAEPETQDQEYQSVSTDSEKHSAKRQRSTFEEMAARRVQDLEKLKKTVTDGWTEKRKENHTRAIDDLVSKVSKDTEKRNKQAASKSIPKSSVLAQRAAPMKESRFSNAVSPNIRKAVSQTKTLSAPFHVSIFFQETLPHPFPC